MNKIIMTGRLTDDAFNTFSKANNVVVSFKLAVERTKKVEGHPTADFFRCVAFGKLAEYMSKSDIRKGTKLLIEGELRNSDYTDTNGTKHYGNDIVINCFEFCEKKKTEPVPVPASEPEHTGNAIDSGNGYCYE